MKKEYTIQEFYLLLKLGIFQSGKVGDWGYISTDSSLCVLKKTVTEYENRPLIKKQIGVGLYLLDLYLLEKDKFRNTHIMVVSVYRAATAQTKVYVLKLITAQKVEEVKSAIQENASLTNTQKYVYKIKPSKQTVAVGKVSKKHYINRGRIT